VLEVLVLVLVVVLQLLTMLVAVVVLLANPVGFVATALEMLVLQLEQLHQLPFEWLDPLLVALVDSVALVRVVELFVELLILVDY
jgi:hypothetical protein